MQVRWDYPFWSRAGNKYVLTAESSPDGAVWTPEVVTLPDDFVNLTEDQQSEVFAFLLSFFRNI